MLLDSKIRNLTPTWASGLRVFVGTWPRGGPAEGELSEASDAGLSGDAKDRIILDDALEVAERRTVVDREERTCPWRQLKVSTQDRGALIGEVLHQRHVFALPALQHRTTVAGAQVTHPVRLLTEHGYQIALTLIVGDNYRERNRPPRLVAT
jgi:hypothetical protein